MVISAYVQDFAGLPVRRLAGDDLPVQELPAFGTPMVAPEAVDPSQVAWRVDTAVYDADFTFEAEFARLLDGVGGERIQALVVGGWPDAYDRPPPLELLVSAAPRLPHLRALFVGEMDYEQCEISWIVQDDVTPLPRAYPRLEVLRVRGATGLRLGPVRHDALRQLAVESGGLPHPFVEAVVAADLPALAHLELWLGTARYGGDATVDHLAAVLSGARFPHLRYLGLRDAEIADQLAAALAAAPVVAGLKVLDLSMGTLGDAGAEALLTGQPLTHLERLDLRHHFLSEEMAARIVAELPGVAVDVGDPQDESDRGRFVSVAE